MHGGVLGAGVDVTAPFAPASVPIYQTATFSSSSSISSPRFDYTRSANPTRHALQQQLAAIEGAAHAFAFTTGMAALSTVTSLLAHGQGVLASDDSYGGTVRLLSRVLDHQAHPVHFCDHTDLRVVEAALTRHPNIRLILVRGTAATPCPSPVLRVILLTLSPSLLCGVQTESPTNPLLRVVDIRGLAQLSHSRGCLLCVDNTMMTPYRQKVHAAHARHISSNHTAPLQS